MSFIDTYRSIAVNSAFNPDLPEEMPILYRAILSSCDHASEQAIEVFTTMKEAKDWMMEQLEEWHESIAFEEDYHHQALDQRFLNNSLIEMF